MGKAVFCCRDTAAGSGFRVQTPSALVQAFNSRFSLEQVEADNITVARVDSGEAGIRPVGGNTGDVRIAAGRKATVSGREGNVFEEYLEQADKEPIARAAERFRIKTVQKLPMGKRMANAGMVFSLGTAAFAGLMAYNFMNEADEFYLEYKRAGATTDFNELREKVNDRALKKDVCVGVAATGLVSGTLFFLTARKTEVAFNPSENKITIAWRF
jgi:hypothetical protein